MLSEQHCSGCTKFSNKVKATVTWIFFSLSQMARGFWHVNVKGFDQSFLCIIKPTYSAADGEKCYFFIFAASPHLPSVDFDVLKHAFSFEASLS